MIWGELNPQRDTQGCSVPPLGKGGPLPVSLGAILAPPRGSFHP